MNTIETLIAEARERQIAYTVAYRERKEQDARNNADRLQEDFIHTFGTELFTLLDAESVASVEDGPRICFAYQGRDYSLRSTSWEGMTSWYLTRLDPRAEDDERGRPTADFTERRRDPQANRDALVLALYEIDQAENVPWPVRPIEPAPAPRIMDEYEERMIDALREWMQSAI